MLQFVAVTALLQGVAMAEPSVTPLHNKSNHEVMGLLFQVRMPERVWLVTQCLRERFEEADAEERTRMVRNFCARCETLLPTMPTSRDELRERADSYFAYVQYASYAPKIFPPAEALYALKRLLFDKDYPGSLEDYSHALAEAFPVEACGPETAAAALELHRYFDLLPPGGHLWCFGSPRELAEAVMERSGEAGRLAMAQLSLPGEPFIEVTLGKKDVQDEFIAQCRRLWPHTDPTAILYCFSLRIQRVGDERLRQALREELPRYLAAPPGRLRWDVDMAVAAAGNTGDAYSLPYLDKLEGVASAESIEHAREQISQAMERHKGEAAKAVE